MYYFLHFVRSMQYMIPRVTLKGYAFVDHWNLHFVCTALNKVHYT